MLGWKLVKAADIRAFARRDWAAIQRLKQDQWREQKRALPPSAAIQLAAGLFQFVRTLKPDWPNPQEREADLASHIRVAGILHRAAERRTR